MKKRFLIFLVLVFSLALPLSVCAYTAPSDAYYMNLQTRELGEVVVYLPYNNARYFSYNPDTKVLVNTSSSQITGYAYNGSWYTVRFPSFDVPNYRPESGTNTYNDLTITGINETNITFLNDTDFTAFSSSTISNLTMLLIGGCILLCLFIKH